MLKLNCIENQKTYKNLNDDFNDETHLIMIMKIMIIIKKKNDDDDNQFFDLF